MNPRPLFCLALVLGSLAGCKSASSPKEQAAESATLAAIKWTDTTVTVYRAIGRPIHLPARRAAVTDSRGPYTYNLFVRAFVDPKTGNSWLGAASDFPTSHDSFYFETEDGIYYGQVLFSVAGLGAVMPWEHGVTNGMMASGEVLWFGSLVPRVKRGETVEDVIRHCDQNGGCEWAVREWGRDPRKPSIIENSLYRVENGLNPWHFIDSRGPKRRVTTIKKIKNGEGKLRLDLLSPSGAHKASVWIDPNTWKVVKVIEDGKT